LGNTQAKYALLFPRKTDFYHIETQGSMIFPLRWNQQSLIIEVVFCMLFKARYKDWDVQLGCPG
jgi:hypothetical protein